MRSSTRKLALACLLSGVFMLALSTASAIGDTIWIKLSNGATPPADNYQYVNQYSTDPPPSAVIKRPGSYFVYSDASGSPGNIGYIDANLDQYYGGNVTVRVQTTNGGTGANNVGRTNLTQLWSGSAWSSIGNSKITGTLGNVQVTKVGASGGGVDLTGGIGAFSGILWGPNPDTPAGAVAMTFSPAGPLSGTISAEGLSMTNVSN